MMRTQTPKNRTRRFAPATLLALGLSALAVAGCDDDPVIYAHDIPPAVPTGVTTITGDQRIEILWNPVYEDDVVGYGVYRSDQADGIYVRITTIEEPEGDSFIDQAVSNGITYFYAVDAYDQAGQESDLSYELAFDTPRPDSEPGGAAQGPVTVYARQTDAGASALDFSFWHQADRMVTGNADLEADIVFQRVGGLLYAVGTDHGQVPNNIQDLGWTESMNEVTWSPPVGWSVAADGLELIEGHTYVVWTWDLHFAKFRVVHLDNPQNPSSALLDWAYQIDPQNQELSAHVGSFLKSRSLEGRASQ